MLRFALLIALAIAPLAHGQIQAAAAVRVITPDPLLPVSGGVGTPQPVTEKRGELYARALVLADRDTRVAIVNLDSLGFPEYWCDLAREQVKGVPPQNVLIGATHTHSAPDAYGFPDSEGNHGADLDYLEWVCAQIAEAVNEAVGKLEPVTLKVAIGEAKGKIAYNYYAPQLYDPRCNVLQALGENGKPVATLINYAIHPEVLGNERGILSADLCAPLYGRIEAKGGGTAIFMNGALGGMVTADTRRDVGEENTWEECIRIGELLADEALRIIAEGEVLDSPDLRCADADLTLPVDNEGLRYILEHSPVGYRVNELGQVRTRLNVVTLGPIQMVTIPGEALPNIGYYLKRKLPTEYPFLFGLTNDAFGYIITKEDYDSFGRYAYITRTCLGEKTAELYMDSILKLAEHTAASR